MSFGLDVIALVLPCENDTKHFKSQQQAKFWIKLHKKKCSKCACAKEYEHNENSMKYNEKELATNPNKGVNRVLQRDSVPIVL
jgi:hypothetical protein